MSEKTGDNDSTCVDKGLVAYFLKLSVEERLRANDNAVRAILELRNAFKEQQTNMSGPKRTS